jgi:hypothetical protein
MIRARVRKEHPTHTVEAREVPKGHDLEGWLQPVRLDESGKPVERIGAYFLELSDRCCC